MPEMSSPSDSEPPVVRAHRPHDGKPVAPAARTGGHPARRADLLGAWTLVSYTVTSNETGTAIHPLGMNAVGLLIYSPDGHMSAQLENPDRANEVGTPARDADPIARAGRLAYGGPFTVDGTTGMVAHHLYVCSRPDWLHTNQHRHTSIYGDELVLSFTGADHHTTALTWRRLKAQTPR